MGLMKSLLLARLSWLPCLLAAEVAAVAAATLVLLQKPRLKSRRRRKNPKIWAAAAWECSVTKMAATALTRCPSLQPLTWRTLRSISHIISRIDIYRMDYCIVGMQ